MGRRKSPIPAFQFHAPTGQHYYWDGTRKKRIYLGSDRDQAEREYRARIGRLAAGGSQAAALPPAGEISVAELLVEFVRRVTPDYPDRRAVDRINAAVRNLSAFAGRDLADRFLAQRLIEFRRHLVSEAKRPDGQPLSRRYINYQIGIVKWIWMWAAENEYLRSETAFRLKGVRPLRKGKGGAERPRVAPVEGWQIDAVVPAMGPIVAGMVRLQQWTGCRPGEVCRMRRRDLSTSEREAVPIPETKLEARAREGVWLYVPESHKNTTRGKSRVIAIGGRGQEVLVPLLRGRKPDDVVFDPALTIALYPDDAERKISHLAAPVRLFYDRYSYNRAIERAIARVNRQRLAAGRLLLVGPDGLVPHWSPGQIRHTTATAVRERFGREAAAEYLGHAGLDQIDRYAEQAIETAVRVAKEMG